MSDAESDTPNSPSTGPVGAAALAATVLDEEARREARQEASEVLFADELLPGVKSEGIKLRKGLRMGGGAATFVILDALWARGIANSGHHGPSTRYS